MPSAPGELQDWAIERFGDLSDNGPMRYLESQGFELTRDWKWIKDDVTRYDELNSEEWMAMIFLAREWDFGGLEGIDK